MVALEAHPNCRFYVEIGGVPQAVFTEVSGLQAETVMFDYEEGGNNGFVHRLPGLTRVSNLTLKRGMAGSHEFFKWYLEITRGKILRRNISVVMYDVTGKVLVRWDLLNAYPIKWIGPQLN